MNLRGTFYFLTVWSMVVLEMLGLLLLTEGFFALYFISWVVLVAFTVFTAGFGIAEFLQARYDERKLRKQTEKYLYTQTTSHSEGDL